MTISSQKIPAHAAGCFKPAAGAGNPGRFERFPVLILHPGIREVLVVWDPAGVAGSFLPFNKSENCPEGGDLSKSFQDLGQGAGPDRRPLKMENHGANTTQPGNTRLFSRFSKCNSHLAESRPHRSDLVHRGIPAKRIGSSPGGGVLRSGNPDIRRSRSADCRLSARFHTIPEQWPSFIRARMDRNSTEGSRRPLRRDGRSDPDQSTKIGMGSKDRGSQGGRQISASGVYQHARGPGVLPPVLFIPAAQRDLSSPRVSAGRICRRSQRLFCSLDNLLCAASGKDLNGLNPE